MVKPRDHGTPLAIVLDQVDLPEGMAGVEPGACKLARCLLQLPLAGTWRQSQRSQMLVEIELPIGDPASAECVVHRQLAKTLEAQQPLGEQGAQPRARNPPLENQYSEDRHGVARALHTQPRKIDPAHRFARHATLLPRMPLPAWKSESQRL
jgi:hypothetical protein